MDNYHTYFVAYVIYADDGTFKVNNGVFATCSTGVQLARDAVHFVDKEAPGATLISISKLD